MAGLYVEIGGIEQWLQMNAGGPDRPSAAVSGPVSTPAERLCQFRPNILAHEAVRRHNARPA